MRACARACRKNIRTQTSTLAHTDVCSCMLMHADACACKHACAHTRRSTRKHIHLNHCMKSPPGQHTNSHAQVHRHTGTPAHRHRGTEAQRLTVAHTHTRTHAHTLTRSHAHTLTPSHTHTPSHPTTQPLTGTQARRHAGTQPPTGTQARRHAGTQACRQAGRQAGVHAHSGNLVGEIASSKRATSLSALKATEGVLWVRCSLSQIKAQFKSLFGKSVFRSASLSSYQHVPKSLAL